MVFATLAQGAYIRSFVKKDSKSIVPLMMSTMADAWYAP
jgi:hypothetical protein